jgi:ABC-type Na+ efflux pump permease subunit
MSPVALLVFVAALAVLASLASGIASMVHDGEIAHQTSAEWMVWRVVFQAAAVLIIVFALFVS